MLVLKTVIPTLVSVDLGFQDYVSFALELSSPATGLYGQTLTNI